MQQSSCFDTLLCIDLHNGSEKRCQAAKTFDTIDKFLRHLLNDVQKTQPKTNVCPPLFLQLQGVSSRLDHDWNILVMVNSY